MKFLVILLFLFLPLHADNHVLVQENFDAWQFTCIEEQSQKLCDLKELVFDPNTEEVVSYLSITINPDNLTQMQIAFPHAVNLKNPIKFQIDDKESFDLSYSFCNESACFVAEIIAENFVNLFKSGNQVSIKASLLDTREATITYSLTGFTAGYERLFQEVTN
ncbi:invasion associated locus B family protein [Alphaproteobacteria bacterium]|nr:invasion associated locus B family protein [Alphaproteobacteria bacterium]